MKTTTLLLFCLLSVSSFCNDKKNRIKLNKENLQFPSILLNMQYWNFYDGEYKLDVFYNQKNSAQILVTFRKKWSYQKTHNAALDAIKQELSVNISKKDPTEAWGSGFKIPSFVKLEKTEELTKDLSGLKFTNNKPSGDRYRKHNFYVFQKHKKGWIILKYTSDKPIKVDNSKMIEAINLITKKALKKEKSGRQHTVSP